MTVSLASMCRSADKTGNTLSLLQLGVPKQLTENNVRRRDTNKKARSSVTYRASLMCFTYLSGVRVTLACLHTKSRDVKSIVLGISRRHACVQGLIEELTVRLERGTLARMEHDPKRQTARLLPWISLPVPPRWAVPAHSLTRSLAHSRVPSPSPSLLACPDMPSPVQLSSSFQVSTVQCPTELG